MTDFDFAGFLDTDNQKNFAISLIKLFDSIILDQNAEQILHHVNEVQKNSICNDFGGLVSALSNFNLKNISSKLSLLSVINLIPEESSNFETILITLNDSLVDKYLNGKINYLSITKNLLKLIKSPFLLKYYKLKPKSIYDIKKMINLTNNFIENKIKNYAK